MNLGNIPPSILRSLNAQPMQWKVALGEACDNSFDSKANWVRIRFTGDKQVEISDDGEGCDNIEAMLTIGRHYRQHSTKLGRFGVGLKELACWLWGELWIQTIHGGIQREVVIDWEKLARSSDWIVTDPDEEKAKDGQRGTRLLFRRAMRNRPQRLEELANDLGYLFAPALWNGKQIAIEHGKRKLTVIPWQLPEFEGEVVKDLFQVDGKKVQLTAGVVAGDSTNLRKGFTFIHEHRVLLNSALGAKGRSVSRICGTVILGPEWKLGKNKDAIQDSDDTKQALEEAIYSRCEALFERGEKQANFLHNSAFEGAVTEALKTMLSNGDCDAATKKAKRKPAENETGLVEPKNTDKKHKRASKEQSGSSFAGNAKLSSMRFEWETGADAMIGRCDIPGSVVYLNENHPRAKHHKENENVDAIADLCAWIITEEVMRDREQNKLPLFRDYSDMTTAISDVLRRQQETDIGMKHAQAKGIA
jgi:hypothetical protein